MDNKKFYTCRYDAAFKEVFMKPENKDILIPLLESALNIKIEELEYLNLEKNVDSVRVRRKRFDFHVKTKTENIHIEVNNGLDKYTRVRNASFIFHTYSHVTLVGEDYDEDTLFIQVNFTYKLSNKDKLCRIYRVSDTEGKCYINNFIIYEFNMDRIKKMWYSMNEEEKDKYKYMVMMDFSLEELEKLPKKDEVINKYMDEIIKANENLDFLDIIGYEEDNRKIENTLRKHAREEGLAEGKKEGIKEGIKEGKKEEKISNAKKMKEENIDINIISKITGLSIEEISNL